MPENGTISKICVKYFQRDTSFSRHTPTVCTSGKRHRVSCKWLQWHNQWVCCKLQFWVRKYTGYQWSDCRGTVHKKEILLLLGKNVEELWIEKIKLIIFHHDSEYFVPEKQIFVQLRATGICCAQGVPKGTMFAASKIICCLIILYHITKHMTWQWLFSIILLQKQFKRTMGWEIPLWDFILTYVIEANTGWI